MTLNACVPTSATQTPKGTDTKSITPTASDLPSTLQPLPTLTRNFVLFPTPRPFPTNTPFPTLSLVEGERRIRELLLRSIDCSVPCFAGVIPGKTTLSNALLLFSKMGIELTGTKSESDLFRSGTGIKSETGSLVVTFTGERDLIKNVRVFITPEVQKTGLTREWTVFSPETLIRQYGEPFKVELFWGGGSTAVPLDLLMYYDNLDLIVEYYKEDLGTTTKICPLNEQFDNVRIWIGENPLDPPQSAEPLEESTNLTTTSFSKLMVGDPDVACFILKEQPN